MGRRTGRYAAVGLVALVAWLACPAEANAIIPRRSTWAIAAYFMVVEVLVVVAEAWWYARRARLPKGQALLTSAAANVASAGIGVTLEHVSWLVPTGSAYSVGLVLTLACELPIVLMLNWKCRDRGPLWRGAAVVNVLTYTAALWLLTFGAETVW